MTDSKDYWEGHDEACAGVVNRWQEALTLPIPNAGVLGDPKMEDCYRQTEALRQRIADLERDGERLDWLEARDYTVFYKAQGIDNKSVWDGNKCLGQGDTGRQAIDAAIIASQKPDGGGSGK